MESGKINGPGGERGKINGPGGERGKRKRGAERIIRRGGDGSQGGLARVTDCSRLSGGVLRSRHAALGALRHADGPPQKYLCAYSLQTRPSDTIMVWVEGAVALTEGM